MFKKELKKMLIRGVKEDVGRSGSVREDVVELKVIMAAQTRQEITKVEQMGLKTTSVEQPELLTTV